MINIIQNIKLIAVIALAIIAVWFYKDWEFQKAENKLQTENVNQLRKADSLRFTTQILTQSEIKDYLEYQNKELKSQLERAGIKTNRIEKIVNSNYYYQDTTKRTFTGNFIDSTKCLIIKGKIDNNGTVSITNREFKNKTSAVAFWERKEWSFLGIKSRFLGKKQMTAKVIDECGNSQIISINKK